MGVGDSKQEVYENSNFTHEEIDRMTDVYNLLGEKNQRLRGSNEVTVESFEEFFYENPYFGRKLYKFILRYNNSRKMNFNTFAAAAELMCKNSQPYKRENEVNPYHHLSKMEIFFFIVNSKSNKQFLANNNNEKELVVGYEQALKYVINILKIFNQNSTESKVSEKAAKAVIDTVFRSEFGQIDYWTFMLILKEQLFYLNNVFKYYFETKFQKLSVKYHLPQLDSKSTLLSKELITFMYLSNSYMQSSHEMKSLYSSGTDQFDFNKLSKNLLEFKGPTLVLVQFKQQNPVEGFAPKTWLCGGFNTQWENIPGFQGNQETFIFSLTPKFHNFFPNTNSSSLGAKNYAYLSTSGSKPGLGFGGDSSRCRIWIDPNIQNSSYTHHKGDTYKNGYLSDPTGEAQINYIEVWGITKHLNRNSRINTHQKIVQTQKVNLQGGSYIRSTTHMEQISQVNDQKPVEQAILKKNYTIQDVQDEFFPEKNYRSTYDPPAQSNFQQQEYATKSQVFVEPVQVTSTYQTVQQQQITPTGQNSYNRGQSQYTYSTVRQSGIKPANNDVDAYLANYDSQQQQQQVVSPYSNMKYDSN